MTYIHTGFVDSFIIRVLEHFEKRHVKHLAHSLQTSAESSSLEVHAQCTVAVGMLRRQEVRADEWSPVKLTRLLSLRLLPALSPT